MTEWYYSGVGTHVDIQDWFLAFAGMTGGVDLHRWDVVITVLVSVAVNTTTYCHVTFING